MQYRVKDVVHMLHILNRKTHSADWRKNPIVLARMYRYASIELMSDKLVFYPPVADPVAHGVEIAIAPCATNGYGEPFRVPWGLFLSASARAIADKREVVSFCWSKR